MAILAQAVMVTDSRCVVRAEVGQTEKLDRARTGDPWHGFVDHWWKGREMDGGGELRSSSSQVCHLTLDQDVINVKLVTAVFGSLIMAAATQDIAVDGWALTLLSQPNLSYASTAQTIGIGIGNALSFTVFLAFNSVEFSNKYFRSTPLDYGLVSLGGYIRFWAAVFIISTAAIAYFKTEDPVSEDDPDMDVKKVYKVMWSIFRLKSELKNPRLG